VPDRPSTFSSWLSRALETQGLSQAEFARAMGIADTQVSRWRRGQVTPSVHYLQRIAEALGVPRVELDRLAGYPTLVEVEPERGVPEEQAELHSYQARLGRKMAHQLPRGLWRAYVEACEALADDLAESYGKARQRTARERTMGFQREP
jgi:transcriptional regulator with XRE-family HTH domain